MKVSKIVTDKKGGMPRQRAWIFSRTIDFEEKNGILNGGIHHVYSKAKFGNL